MGAKIMNDPFDYLRTNYKDKIEIQFRRSHGRTECTLTILEEDKLYKITRIIDFPDSMHHELRWMEQKLVQNYVNGLWTERHIFVK